MIDADDAGRGQARRVAHQRRPRPARSTSGRSSGRSATGRSAARSSTRSATSRCRRRRRSTTCRTSSSRRTRRGRAAASSTGASSCSATTSAASRRASRCSTWSTRAPATDRRRPTAMPVRSRMQIAIVGLAGSGKTTVFNTLTRGHAETGGYGGVTLNVGVVKVPDDAARPARRDLQAQEDRPGRRHLRRPAGAARRRPRATSGPRSCPPTTSPGCAIRTRCSTSSARSRTRRTRIPTGSVDPARDLERLDLEFLLADLAMAERRLERLKTQRPARHAGRARGERARGGRPAAGSTPALEAGHADPRPRARRRRGEGDPRLPVPDPEARPRAAQRRRGRPRRRAGARGARSPPATPTATRWSTRCRRKIEMELGELEPDEAAVFMEELGIAESGLDRVIALSLPAARADLVPDRRARRGPRLADPATARPRSTPPARSTPTSRKGFIRAETVAYEDLLDARLDGRGAQGRPAPLGGQDLPGPDGDVLEILFSQLSGLGVAGAARSSSAIDA